MENKRGFVSLSFCSRAETRQHELWKKIKKIRLHGRSQRCVLSSVQPRCSHRVPFPSAARLAFELHKKQKIFGLTAPPWQHAGGREQRWRLRGHLSSVRAALSGTSLTRARPAWTAPLLPGCRETETICRPVTSQRER